MKAWFVDCEASFVEKESYSDEFIPTLIQSGYEQKCKEYIPGKLSWNDWQKCPVTCGEGIKNRIAKECVPSYAYCNQIQIQSVSCENDLCPDLFPVGSIIPWIPKPNIDVYDGVDYQHSPGWIKCDGIEVCDKGQFVGEEFGFNNIYFRINHLKLVYFLSKVKTFVYSPVVTWPTGY